MSFVLFHFRWHFFYTYYSTNLKNIHQVWITQDQSDKNAAAGVSSTKSVNDVKCIPVNAMVLPNEIFHMILSYGLTEDILRWRTVGRAWNQMACEYLHHQLETPIKFSSDLYIDKFISLMKARVQQRPLPFSSFEFKLVYSSPEYVDRFLEKGYGSFVTKLILHIDHFPEVQFIQSQLISSTPYLRKLQFLVDSTLGMEDDECKLLKLNIHLPKLRSLVVVPKSMRDMTLYSAGKIELDVLQNWISQAPALTELQCHLYVELDPSKAAHFPQVLSSMFHITEVGFNIAVSTQPQVAPILEQLIRMPGLIQIVNLRLKMSEEFMHQQGDGSLLCQWLETLSEKLQTLALIPNNTNNLALTSIYQRLESLELDYTYIYQNNEVFRPFQSYQFPALKDVKIVGAHKYNRIIFGNDESFPTVRNLYLANYNMAPSIPDAEQFHLRFPNLTSLRVFFKDIQNEQVFYIFRNFSNLIHLQIRALKVADKKYFEFLTGGLRKSQISWNDGTKELITLKPNVNSTVSAFANFKNLKRLEISGKRLNNIFLAILYLTAVKQIPRWDSLILQGVERNGKLITYGALDRYKWHKKVSILHPRHKDTESSTSSSSDDDF